MNSQAGAKSQEFLRFIQHGERAQQSLPQPAFHGWTFPDGTPWTRFYRQANGYLLRFAQLADFWVSKDGTQVRAWPALGVTATTVQQLHLNQVVPLALSRQGKLVLHASAVQIAGKAVAFIGESGRGKSTIAASFATNGCCFLTDDGLQLDWRENQLIVMPSHPSIRLWEDSQCALVTERTATAPAVEYTNKARFLAGPEIAFCSEPSVLQRIYFLGLGKARVPEFTPTRPAAAMMQLVRHSFLLDIAEKEVLSRHFEDLSRIAHLPIHFELDYVRRYEDLDFVRQAIARHATHLVN